MKTTLLRLTLALAAASLTLVPPPPVRAVNDCETTNFRQPEQFFGFSQCNGDVLFGFVNFHSNTQVCTNPDGTVTVKGHFNYNGQASASDGGEYVINAQGHDRLFTAPGCGFSQTGVSRVSLISKGAEPNQTLLFTITVRTDGNCDVFVDVQVELECHG